MPTLTLIRGLPGSGKSTLAKQLQRAASKPTRHLEADMFFTGTLGNYRYVKEDLGKVHAQCLREAKWTLLADFDVIVSNVFYALWQMHPYLQLLPERQIQILECKGNFGSVHNVPEEAVTRMWSRWEEFRKV